jgi:hypothetical protein
LVLTLFLKHFYGVYAFCFTYAPTMPIFWQSNCLSGPKKKATKVNSGAHPRIEWLLEIFLQLKQSKTCTIKAVNLI